MALMPSMAESLSATERATLLDVARYSIAHGIEYGRALVVEPAQYPSGLRPVRATFVTLQRHGQLRGCVGVLEASQPLVRDVTIHAYAAAFEDHRFAPVTAPELAELDIHVSVLSPPAPLPVNSQAELFGALRPGVDGLILRYRGRRATFLPAVWEHLPKAQDFVTHLKQKAGLARDFWSTELRFERYTTESFP